VSDTAEGGFRAAGHVDTRKELADCHDAMVDFCKERHRPFGADGADHVVDDGADTGFAEEAEIAAFGRKPLVELVNRIAIVRSSRPQVNRRSVSQHDVSVVLR
jgi:hypothetical protein